MLFHVLLTLSNMLLQLCDAIALFCVNSPVLSPTVYCRDALSANLKLTSNFKSKYSIHVVQQKYKFRNSQTC